MARGRSIRDLFVRIGFDADDTPLRNIDRGVDSLKGNLRTLRNVLIGVAGAGGLGGFLLKLSGEFEQAEVSFEVMLGSVEKSRQVLEDLYNFAKTTPFEIRDIIGAGKQLLAFGIETDKLIDTLTMLGNVAAGTVSPGQSLNENFKALARNFGQVRTAQRLMGRDTLDFANRGVPIYEELAKVMGVQTEQIRKMGESGSISFDIVEKAFINMSSEGGKFFNLMERQSKTFLGIWSNIKDVIVLVSKDLGKTLLPQAKAVQMQFLKFLEVNKKIIQQKGKKIFTEIGRGIMFAFKVAKDFGATLLSLTEIFGGLENTIKLATAAMFIMFSISMLSGIGNIFIGLVKIVAAFTAIGNAAAMAQIKAFAFPLLVGVGIAALILIVQDLWNYFDPKGKETLTELIVDAFENKYPGAIDKTISKLNEFKDTINNLFPSIKKIFEVPTFFKGLEEKRKAAGLPREKATPSFGKLFNLENWKNIFDHFGGLTPATSPATTTNTINRSAPVSMTIGDINITTPPGADAGEIADTVKEVIEKDILGPAYKTLRPSEVQ